MNTISAVLEKLDQIIQECRSSNSRIGYFAILYRQVTQRVLDGIIQGEFEDNPRMETLDVLFAKRFIDAYALWKANQNPTLSWLVAFDASQSTKHLVLQHILLGINAHINLDLGIATSETMKGKNLADIKGDFDRINSILAQLVNGVKANISVVSPIFGTLIPLAKGRDEMLLNFSISRAREGAWELAIAYHHDSKKDFLVQNRDKTIAKIAQKLINPGRWLQFLVRLIGLAEWKSVRKTMDQLEQLHRKRSTL